MLQKTFVIAMCTMAVVFSQDAPGDNIAAINTTENTIPEKTASAIKNWSIALEAGAGALGTLNAEYRFALPLGSIGAGLYTGFDYQPDFLVGDQRYPLVIISPGVQASYHLFQNETVILDVRVRVGMSFVAAGEYNGYTMDLAPELLAGGFGFYAILSGSCVIGIAFEFQPQIGIGYRFCF